jgi:molecular chaperone GrpE
MMEHEPVDERTGAAAAPDGASDEYPDDSAELKTQLREARELAETNRQQWLRAAADYRNLQRRAADDVNDRVRFATQAILLNVISLVDDFERALQSVEEHVAEADAQWVEGVRMIYRKMQALLAAAGVEQIHAAPGQPFDPNLHEAVAHIPGEENTVVAVAQKGYTVGGKPLRAAQVAVGSGAPPAGDDA